MSARAEGAWLSSAALGAGLASCAGAAALAHCALLAALFRTTTNGLFSILLQLALADIILGAAISIEIWTLNAGSWSLGAGGCIAYRGLGVFAATASAYLIVTVALHTMASAHLEEKSLMKRLRRNQDEEEEIRSSRHSLVAGSDSSTPPRSMNLEYRASGGRVALVQPTLFVWLLAASLSVPEFALASTVQAHDRLACTVIDSTQRLHLYTILNLFNMFLPILLMCAAAALLVVKIKSKGYALMEIEGCESVAALKLSLWMIAVYVALCAPRAVLTTSYVYSNSTETEEWTSVEPVYRVAPLSGMALGSSCVYFSSVLVRPILCIVLLPNVRKAFSYRRGDIESV